MRKRPDGQEQARRRFEWLLHHHGLWDRYQEAKAALAAVPAPTNFSDHTEYAALNAARVAVLTEAGFFDFVTWPIDGTYNLADFDAVTP